MDASMVCFMARIAEAEALLDKRRADLAARQQKRADLEQQLVFEESKQNGVLKDHSAIQGALEALTGSKIQLKHDISRAREQLHKEQATTGLAAEERFTQQQLDRLTSTTQNEQQLQQQYAASISNHMNEMRSQIRVLEARATKLATKFGHLKQQEERLCLDKQLHRLKHKQATLHTEIAQLTATLTDTKQANVVARTKVAATTKATASELQGVQDRIAIIKVEAFQMGREQSVKDTRLKQLQHEGGRLRQQCSELDQLIARASATIDQLTNCVDL